MAEHGTVSSYWGGCRCEDCRTANRNYSRKRRGIPLDQPVKGRDPWPISHGTAGGYNHGCRCRDCRRANTERVKKAIERRAGRPVPAWVEHGKQATYNNWSCRCDECREANNAVAREYYARRRNNG